MAVRPTEGLEPVRRPEESPLPPGEAAPNARRSSLGRNLGVALGIAAGLAFAAYGLHAWIYARAHESTDDAQVEGHIIPVLARVGGYVRSVEATDNQRVQAGDLLVEIDDRDLVARLRQAEADLATALSDAGPEGQAAADRRAAEAAVAQARAEDRRANADLARYRELSAEGVLAPTDLDAAVAAAASADAALAAAQNRVAAAGARARGADSRVASARAARDQAALMLSYARIRAPERGVVSKKSVEVGQLVESGQALMAVVPLDSVWVVANLKETQLQHLEPGQPVEVRADAYPGRDFHGHVESLSPATGSKFSLLPPDNATGNFVKVVQRVPVRIALDDSNDPAHPLRPGMSVHVSVQTRP
jgi:membrane fusion protein (multidrug efflux system)